MSVYNNETYLNDAVESILNQTFQNLELILIDDGSTDSTPDIIKEFNDSRIITLKNNLNKGLAASLNYGITQAQGKYIARMDSDDISHPERLEKQFNFMENNPQTGLCGTFVETLSENKPQKFEYSTDPEKVRCELLFYPAVAHPSVMIRAEVLKKNNLAYDESFKYAQDYDLWARLSEHTPITNIPEILLTYRVHPKTITSEARSEQLTFARQIRNRYFTKLNINPSEEEINIHESLRILTFEPSEVYLTLASIWLAKLIKHNKTHRVFHQEAFIAMLSDYWYNACTYSGRKIGFRAFQLYISDLPEGLQTPALTKSALLLIRSLL